jgi:hypothetical protein
VRAPLREERGLVSFSGRKRARVGHTEPRGWNLDPYASLYWTAAGVSAAATAILGYVSYRRTGAVGPVRF